MAVDVVVLGSGSPLPDPERAGPALAVVGDAGWVLVDCGRAATQRAIDAGLDLTAVVAVALTHHHSDHVSDLATLATARWVAGATTPLVVVAPEGPSVRFARRCLDIHPGVLVLTHLIPAPRSVEAQRDYLDEVTAGGFAGSTLVAHDGLRITLAEDY